MRELLKNKIWFSLAIIFVISLSSTLFMLSYSMSTEVRFKYDFTEKLVTIDLDRGETYYVILSKDSLIDGDIELNIKDLEIFSNPEKVRSNDEYNRVYYGKFKADIDHISLPLDENLQTGENFSAYSLIKEEDIKMYRFFNKIGTVYLSLWAITGGLLVLCTIILKNKEKIIESISIWYIY